MEALEQVNTILWSRTDFNTNVWRYMLYHADGADAGQRVQLNSRFLAASCRQLARSPSLG